MDRRQSKFLIRLIVYGTLGVLLATQGVRAIKNWGPHNGFDIGNSSLPAEEIRHGGPGRDGIPAIDHPQFDTVQSARQLADSDRILGIDLQGQQRAYPIAILNWHEIVNDQIGNRAILVSYCPLCGTGMAFEARARDRQSGFGVSGLLYNSDMLLYDRDSDSLWSQILSRAISGPRKGERLPGIPLTHTTWGDWRQQHPDTLVLNQETGHRRDYSQSAYQGYDQSSNLYFPVSSRDNRYHPKEPVLGMVIKDRARVWPLSELAKAQSPIQETFNQQELVIHYDAEHEKAWITDRDGEALVATRGYWFAWMAFHPESQVFQAGGSVD